MEAIIMFLVTIVAGVFAEATVGIKFNMPGFGTLLAVAIMGAVIIQMIKNKK